MSGFFVTGTDTGVGKTFVSTALARRAVALGRQVFGFKPIETGCVGLGDDQRALVDAAGGWQTGALAGVYQFPLPASPLVAANDVGEAIDLDRVEQVFVQGREASNFWIVEGAGGWRVPITETVDMAGLAKRMGLPTLLVARAGLGTINHSLLSIEAIERDGCRVGAVVVSRLPADDRAFAESNRAQILRRWPGTVLILDSDPAVLDLLFHVEQ